MYSISPELMLESKVGVDLVKGTEVNFPAGERNWRVQAGRLSKRFCASLLAGRLAKKVSVLLGVRS